MPTRLVLRVLLGWLACCAPLCAAEPAVGPAETREVKVAEYARVSGERVLLGDVATLRGFSKEEDARLSELYLARAPRPGEKSELNNTYLRRLLLARAPQAALSLPARVVVEREAKRVSAAELRQMLTDEAARIAGVPAERVVIGRMSQSGDWLLPVKDAQLLVSFPAGARFRGQTTAKLSAISPQGRAIDSYITAEVTIKSMAVLVKRAVARGKSVGSEDVELYESDSSRLPPGAFTRLEDVVGQEAQAPLVPGAIVSEGAIVAPLLIKRGAVVRLIAENGELRIETRGIALEPGRQGQTIRAKNLQSQKAVYGAVVTAEEIHVAF